MDRERDAIVITGASRGIGLATAKQLAGEGRQVVGIARNPPDDGFPGRFYSADLADRRATQDLLTEISSAHQVTGLVNNLGINVLQSLEDVTSRVLNASLI